MKYYENNSYVNHGAIPSNEYAQNKTDRATEYDIEAGKVVSLEAEAARLLKRSLWLLQKKQNAGSKSSVNGFGWRANGSSMDMLLQFEYNEPTTYLQELPWAY